MTTEESNAIAEKCEAAFQRAQAALARSDKPAFDEAKAEHDSWGALHHRLFSGATLQ